MTSKKSYTVITSDDITLDKQYYFETPEEAAAQAFPLIIKLTKKQELDDIIDFRLIDDDRIKTVYMFIGDPTNGEVGKLNFRWFIQVLADREKRRKEKQNKKN